MGLVKLYSPPNYRGCLMMPLYGPYARQAAAARIVEKVGRGGVIAFAYHDRAGIGHIIIEVQVRGCE